MPAFRAFTGADTTGRFARLGKQSGYRNARKLMTTWRLLCKEAELSEDVFTSLTRFVCSAYCPSGINISNIPELRWHLFCENMAENARLHPTAGALQQHIMRVHIQACVWGQAAISYHADMTATRSTGHVVHSNRLPLMFSKH